MLSPMENLITSKTAARLLGVTIRQIQALNRRGVLKAAFDPSSPGGRSQKLYDRDDVLALKENRDGC